MAARRPFWKWHRWKSIGFCLWPPSTCIWNLKLKFQSKLDLCSGNHAVYRQTDGRTDGQTDRRTRWIQYTPPPTSLGGGIKTLSLNGAETRLFLADWVNTMFIDALAPCITRSSATMVLIMKDKQVLVFHKNGFQCPVPSPCWENILIFSKINSAWQRLSTFCAIPSECQKFHKLFPTSPVYGSFPGTASVDFPAKRGARGHVHDFPPDGVPAIATGWQTSTRRVPWSCSDPGRVPGAPASPPDPPP